MGNINNNAMNKKLLIPFVLVLICSVVMITTLFMPYATASDEYSKVLNAYPDEVVYEGFDMVAEDMTNISMVEYANVYRTLSEQIWGNSSYGIFYVILVALIGGLSLLTLLFAILKKPIAIMIFDILAFGVFSVQNWDYKDRGVIPSSSYDWGMAYYIFYIVAVLALIGAIWMLIIKVKNKKSTYDNI